MGDDLYSGDIAETGHNFGADHITEYHSFVECDEMAELSKTMS